MVGLRAKRPHFTEKWLRFTLHFVAHFYSARNKPGVAVVRNIDTGDFVNPLISQRGPEDLDDPIALLLVALFQDGNGRTITNQCITKFDRSLMRHVYRILHGEPGTNCAG